MKSKLNLLTGRLIICILLISTVSIVEFLPKSLSPDFFTSNIYIYIVLGIIVFNSLIEPIRILSRKKKFLYYSEDIGYFFSLFIIILFLTLAHRYFDIGIICFIFYLRYYTWALRERLNASLESTYTASLSNYEKKYLKTNRNLSLVITFLGFGIFLYGAFVSPYPLSETFTYLGMTFIIVSSSKNSFSFISFMFNQIIYYCHLYTVHIKNKTVVEDLSKATTIVFNKGDVITTEEYKLKYVKSAEMDPKELLTLAGYGLYYSNHPIAKAIKSAAGPIDKEIISQFNTISGHGCSVLINGKVLYIGNYKLMCQMGYPDMFLDPDCTLLHLASDENYLGFVAFTNTVEPTAKQALTDLKELEIFNTYLYTGDRHITTEKLADELGISEIKSGIGTRKKAEYLGILKEGLSDKEKLIFVGGSQDEDSLLSVADVGIYLNSSDDEMPFQNIVIASKDLTLIPSSIKLCRRAMVKIDHISFSNYLFMLLPIAAVLFGITSPLPAILAILFSSCIEYSICNSK